jgi:peptidoglycan/LPS O-acetylase OafA/YrhL
MTRNTAGATAPATADRPAVLVPGRDRYLDLLRALALVWIVALHTFWQAAWLTVVFPSLGVMFALAGALMARSLDRPTGQVLRSRARRLLLPLGAYSIVAVGLLLVHGWRPPAGDAVGWWLRLVLWFVPIGTPSFPAADPSGEEYLPLGWGEDAADILWYIRSYFWFVLLSPLLLAAFKRLPWVTMAAPLVLLFVMQAGLLPVPDQPGRVLDGIATYGTCWVLGFAYQRGFLQALPRIATPLVALAFMAFGFWWAAGHHADTGWDLGAIPIAQAFWSVGFVVLLLRVSPSWSEFPRLLRPFDGVITLINNRAMTVYLWHIVLLISTLLLIDRLWEQPAIADSVPWLLDSPWLQFAGVWVLLGLVILAVGWVEDLAARRPLRLWPTGRRNRRPREDVQVRPQEGAAGRTGDPT